MLKWYSLFLLLISSISADPSKISVDAAPSWVKECHFVQDASKPKEQNFQYLLVDNQIHWEEKTTYIHEAIQAVSRIGVEKISQMRVVFDPTYQHICVHSIGIYRDGKYQDRTNSRRELPQRELELDTLYEGHLTLVYFLEDVRPGDILEYSYSCIGMHPMCTSHFTYEVDLQEHSPVKRLYNRLLMHPDQVLNMKCFNKATKPKIIDLSPTLREYSWEIEDAPAISHDDDTPSWYVSKSYAHLSQYENWRQVVDAILPYYSIPLDLMTAPSPEMEALIEQWKEATSDPKELALLATRFVQDEVRYLGFEEGIRSAKPSDPRIIFQRRFGDCKDKVVLLQNLLHLMEISSTPVLVNAFNGKRIVQLLPDPKLFNHVILQIQIGDKISYVDATISFQGGDIETLFFPTYFWGLLISDSRPEIIRLPDDVLQNPHEIDISIVLTSPHSAEVSVNATTHGSDADMFRRGLSAVGVEKLREIFLQGMQTEYKSATVLKPLIISDDRENNTTTFQGSYQISTRNRAGKRILKVVSSILSDFDLAIKLDRKSPYQLEHPEWTKEHIHVENRFNEWTPETENVKIFHDSFQYRFSMTREAHAVDFDLEYKTLKDYVPAHKIQEYWDVLNEIESNHLLELVISEPRSRRD